MAYGQGINFIPYTALHFLYMKIHRIVAKYQILDGHTVNMGVRTGGAELHKSQIFDGLVPVCSPYRYSPAFSSCSQIMCEV